MRHGRSRHILVSENDLCQSMGAEKVKESGDLPIWMKISRLNHEDSAVNRANFGESHFH